MPGLDVDDVMSAAVALAGSDDFGPDAFVEGLTVLCASANDEAQLSELGQFALQQNVTQTATDAAQLRGRNVRLVWDQEHEFRVVDAT